MAKRLSFGGSSKQEENAAGGKEFSVRLAEVKEEEVPRVSEGRLAKELRRQSMDGTIPVSLQALQVSVKEAAASAKTRQLLHSMQQFADRTSGILLVQSPRLR